VAGISTAYYRRGLAEDDAFTDLLREFYPWDLEPDGGEEEQPAALLWSAFRNPAARRLGTSFTRTGPRVPELDPWAHVVRFSRCAPSLSEADIEALERSTTRPALPPTVSVQHFRRQLTAEPFYWGVRTLLYRLSCDAQIMAVVEEELLDATEKMPRVH
jgi:hypothetical protein